MVNGQWQKYPRAAGEIVLFAADVVQWIDK
jgi:hypothetical protein